MAKFKSQKHYLQFHQYLIGNYIVDFVCQKTNKVITASLDFQEVANAERSKAIIMRLKAN
jgi:very-short-patch-repair endonuclease